MVEVMKIMVTSFKRSHPNPAAGHPWPTPPLETPGHSRASLGQSLGDLCSFFLGPEAHKVLFIPFKSLFPQSSVSAGSAMVGLMVTSSKRAYAISWSTAPRAPQNPFPCSRPLMCISTGEVKWAFRSITTNKGSRGDGILVELFQILKDDAVTVLPSICQQIWKTRQWPQD